MKYAEQFHHGSGRSDFPGSGAEPQRAVKPRKSHAEWAWIFSALFSNVKIPQTAQSFCRRERRANRVKSLNLFVNIAEIRLVYGMNVQNCVMKTVYANGNAEKIKRKFGNISHFFWLKRKICTNYTVA